MKTGLQRTVRPIWQTIVIAGLMAAIGGCSHQNSAASAGSPPPPATPVFGDNPKDPVANNPAPGKPNHLSPEMQAQISHYRSMGGGQQ